MHAPTREHLIMKVSVRPNGKMTVLSHLIVRHHVKHYAHALIIEGLFVSPSFFIPWAQQPITFMITTVSDLYTTCIVNRLVFFFIYI